MGRFQFLIFPLWAWMWHKDRERPKVWVCGPNMAQSLAAHSGPVKAPSFLGQVTASSACLSNWAEDPFFFCSFCLRRTTSSPNPGYPGPKLGNINNHIVPNASRISLEFSPQGAEWYCMQLIWSTEAFLEVMSKQDLPFRPLTCSPHAPYCAPYCRWPLKRASLSAQLGFGHVVSSAR